MFGSFSTTTTKNPSWRETVRTDPAGTKAYLEKYEGNVREAYRAYYSDKQSAQSSSNQQPTTEQTDKASKASLEATKADLRNKINSSQGSKRAFYVKLLESLNGSAESANEALGRMDRWMINQVNSLQRTSNYISNGINSATSSITSSLTGITDNILDFQEDAISEIFGWSSGMKKALEPVGLGSALGDLTEVAKNPLGAPQFIAKSMTSIVDKISPGFAEEMDSAYKTLKLEGLAHLPSKMMGSIRNLATAADAILSVPFEIMSDVYNGLMEILSAIADLIDAVVGTVMNLAMAAARALLGSTGIPVDELIEFFSAIGELASFVGGISSAVGGFSTVTNIAGQVSSYSSFAARTIDNPLGAAIQFIPGANEALGQGLGAIGQVTDALRNPEQFLPQDIRQQMQNLSRIPGLGFVGNLGYSVGDTLDSLSEGVFSKALEKYSDKAPMIGEFLGKETEPPYVDIQENYLDQFGTQKAGLYPEANGIPAVGYTDKILQEETASAYGYTQNLRTGALSGPGVRVDPNGPITAYGYTDLANNK